MENFNVKLKPFRHPRLWLKIGAGLLLLAGLNLLFPSIWYSPEIRAQVVTPDGHPVKGAVVVANWEIQNWISGSAEGQLALYETVTDEQGRFSFPSWGPRFVLYGALDITAPVIHVLHPDYMPLTTDNFEGVPAERAPMIIKFRLQDQQLVLKPFNYSIERYEDQARLEWFMREIRDIYASGWSSSRKTFSECYWQATPNLLAEIQVMNDRLQRQGVELHLRTGYEHAYNDPKYCK